MKLENNPEAGTMTVRGMIGDFEGGISADDFRSLLAEHEGSDLTIHLNSEGGSVVDGLSMFNAIKEHAGKVTVHVDALAASIATVVCCAADEVKMNANGKYMVHRAWTAAMGNCKEFRSTADLMEMMDLDIAAAYSERTNLSQEEALAMMDAETWMSAEEALKNGFIDEVVDPGKSKPQASQPALVKACVPPAHHQSLMAGMSRRLRMNRR